MNVVDNRWTLPRKLVFDPRAVHMELMVECVTLVLPRYDHVTTFHILHPRLESVVLWSHLKPHVLYLQSRPSSRVSFLFKQARKMSAFCRTFAVRKLYSAAVCFVTLHVLNSARPHSLSNVTTLLLNLTFRWRWIVINSYNKTNQMH